MNAARPDPVEWDLLAPAARAASSEGRIVAWRRAGIFRLAWSLLAGCLLSWAFLAHGFWAWPGAVAWGLAIRAPVPARSTRFGPVTATMVTHAVIGLNCWGFVHYGILLYLAVVLYSALAGLLLGLLVTRHQGAGHPNPMRAALGWTAIEFVRQLGPYGFPLALGATQVHLPLSPALGTVGAIGLSGILIGTGVALANLATGLIHRPSPARIVPDAPLPHPGSERTGSTANAPLPASVGEPARIVPERTARLALSTLAWVAAVLSLVVLGSWQPGLEPHGEPMQVAVVQGGIPTWLHQASVWSPSAALEVQNRYFGLTGQALLSDADLVVLPEAALHRRLAADEHGLSEPVFEVPARPREGPAPWVLTGAYREVFTDLAREHLALFNSALLLRGDDPRVVLGAVDKQLIVPLAESEFSRGEGASVLSVGSVDLGVLICWESMYPAWARRQSSAAAVLVILTNDAGFGWAPVSVTHARQGWSRAVETGRPLIRAAQAGISLVADHRGRLLARMGLFDVGVLSARIQPMRGWTWYTLAGHYLGPVALVLSITWLLALRLVAWRTRSKAPSRRA